MRTRARAGPVWAGAALVAGSLGAATVWSQDVELVSRSAFSVAGGGGDTTRDMVSQDGRYTVFVSSSPSLVPGASDSNGKPDVFLYDRVADAISLVSHAAGLPGTAANEESGAPAISADGQFVAFHSFATNLVSGPAAGGLDVFLYERATGTVSLVSHTFLSPTASAGISRFPSISADGGQVAFDSLATTLATGPDTNAAYDVFVYDRATGNVSLVSHATGTPTTAADAQSLGAKVSANGAFVAYSSRASNLIAGSGFIGDQHAYLFGRVSGVNTLLDHAAGSPTAAGNGNSGVASLSADGGWVALVSGANDLVVGTDVFGTNDVFLFERATGAITLVSHAVGTPADAANGVSVGPLISAAGDRLYFVSRATNLLVGTDTNNANDLFLYERAGGTVTLVSHIPASSTTAGNGVVGPIAISSDASQVVFNSQATNLVAGADTNGVGDVFLYQRATGTITLASHALASATTAGNGASDFPVLSGDGAWLGYASLATDLIAGQGLSGQQVYLFEASSGANRLLSRAQGSASANGTSVSGPARRRAVSDDGRYVVFTSNAPNLVPGQTGSGSNVFLHDRATGTSTLVSHVPGAPATGGNGTSMNPELSASGAYVVFESIATDLVAGSDTNGVFDVFLFDRATGGVSLISHAGGAPTTAANGFSSSPTLSADGARAAFLSRGTNLVTATDTPNTTDVFLYDRVGGTVTLVSHVPGSPTTASATGAPDFPAIDATGDHVAFQSHATNLVTGTDTNFFADVFLWDRASGAIVLASHIPASATTTGNAQSSEPSLSADGRRIAFVSGANNLVPGTDLGADEDVFLYDQATGIVRLASHAPASPTVAGNLPSNQARLSANGAFVGFVSQATDLVAGSDANGGVDVFRYDVAADTVTLISHAVGTLTTAGAGRSAGSSVDDSGAMAFISLAPNLVSGSDTNGFDDVFVFRQGTIQLASHVLGTPSTSGNGASSQPQIARSGSHVVFNSTANNLVANDQAGPTDVFVYGPPVGPPPVPAAYFTLPPCRVVDTRTSGPALAANSTRAFAVGGLCQIPADARAVAAIVVAVNPGDLGNLRLYPQGQPVPVASTLNFAAGRTRANNAVLPLGAGGQIAVRCDMAPGSTATTHFLLDVFGYFR